VVVILALVSKALAGRGQLDLRDIRSMVLSSIDRPASCFINAQYICGFAKLPVRGVWMYKR